MTDTPKKRVRPKKEQPKLTSKETSEGYVFEGVNEVLKWAIEASKPVEELPEIPFTFPKKAAGLKGIINTGTIFIGDTGFFAANPQDFPEGIIENDPTNPFKDWDKFHATHQNDCALDLPGSFNGDLPGRGVVIQTNMLSGSYSIEKETCPSTGKLLALRVVFRD